MIRLSLLAFLGLSHFATATCQSCTFDQIVPSQSLVWCPCYSDFFCARLDVPLDYQNVDLGRASVPLVKLPAQANSSFGAYQGMILLNPGGPGASGVELALGNASTVQALVGTNWDVVGFDPRGIYLSEPVANCSYDVPAINTSSIQTRSVPRLSDDYFINQIQYNMELGERCAVLAGGELDAGPHMSTATTARDMLSIVDAFAETEDGKSSSKPSGLLNYYGVSYGTFLGQTFASMFPARVGNVVLDGVVNPESFLANFTGDSITHIDGIIAAFFIYCHEAGPSECSFYSGSSAHDIYERFNQSFAQLVPRVAKAQGWSNATDLESALLQLKIGLLTAANHPIEYFSLMPEILLGLESAIAAQDLAPWIKLAISYFGDANTSVYPEWSFGVLCSDQDNKWYNKTLEDVKPLIEQLEKESIIGELWDHSLLGCLGWSVKATEIFTGPFGGDTATPILFVSNTYDAVTPIENSFSSAPNYKDAQVLVIDGMGHTVSAAQNYCGYAKIAAYFQSNALPGDDYFCALEQGPFGIILNGTLAESIEQAALSDLH
ncbi:hypothetical protein BKA67DRAFT_533283 [Truncatella angustata]|uniref:Alpha/beta-hydrolase n=1 Tax=Truncatella angustata TaxID=152316 RepID=A0A9P8UTK4_9PEZI|nr:uncharacterized protein BKA67DRAFT_533283 [Truncatella angustata]KAH6658109.1 hypothetical protein BKA67DRAFT_533283 [Truncatella angustata]KAH8201329.1 hypothetical protein TruAng_004497 [Truncatella angustata]